MAKSRCTWLIGLTLCLAISAYADSWMAAKVTEVFSKSGDWFVRVVPGKSLGDTVGFSGSPKGPYAKAEFYQRQKDRSYRLVKEITLQNPVAPVLFLVSDRGYLVTFDNWHNMGYGKAVVSYSPQGKPVVSMELKDLFSPEEFRNFSHTVSSIWWRAGNVYWNEGQQSVYVTVDDRGTALILEPETGSWQFCQGPGDAFRCRTSNATRVWKPYTKPAIRK
jgi:hypothetical protein